MSQSAQPWCRREGLALLTDFYELTMMAATEVDNDKRIDMIEEAMQIARDEIAYIPLHQQPLSWAARDNVEIIQFPDNYFRAWHYRVN